MRVDELILLGWHVRLDQLIRHVRLDQLLRHVRLDQLLLLGCFAINCQAGPSRRALSKFSLVV